MLRVLLAPAAVLAHFNPVWIVALALICLVVAALAVLAGEGYSDSNVSAGHVSSLFRSCLRRPGGP